MWGPVPPGEETILGRPPRCDLSSESFGHLLAQTVSVGVVADTQYMEFVAHPRMAAIRTRTVWVHVEVPGQGHDAPDLPPE